jgi:hypothetical protein
MRLGWVMGWDHPWRVGWGVGVVGVVTELGTVDDADY